MLRALEPSKDSSFIKFAAPFIVQCRKGCWELECQQSNVLWELEGPGKF